MGFFKKSYYEKHANNLNKKLTKIVKTMDSRELKDACQKVIGKYPKQGTRLFDSEYNLIQKFGYKISHDDYMLYFLHNRKQGKFSDLKLAKFLIMRDILDEQDPDFDYLKQFAKSEDNLDYGVPRNIFHVTVKDAIRKIQHNRCAIPHCTNTEYFEFDHIKGRDDNSLSNCQMLCKFHHQMKSNVDAIKIRIEKNLKDGGSVRDIHIKSRKTSRPTSRKTSRPTSRKTSRPTSRKTSRPTSRKTSRPTSRKTSRNTRR